MGLKYPSEWKFDGCGFEMPTPAANEFLGLLLKIAGDSQQLVEDFKAKFGGSAWSSSFDWAVTDLRSTLESKQANAAEFIDALWGCIEAAAKRDVHTPAASTINRILQTQNVPFEVAPPNLRMIERDAIIAQGVSTDPDQTEQPANYLRGAMIGSGGYGVVYEATRRTSVGEFECAIKVLDPSPFVTDHAKALARFRREIAAMRSLQHRAIVPYFDAGISFGQKPYIVMPLVRGHDLRTACAALPVRERVMLFREVASGVSYAHSQDVLHRDLKPSNVIVRSSDSQPIILDFGAAYLLDQLDSSTLTSQAVGTVGYIPNEVLANPSIRSPLQDSYACGVMLYEALAGYRPDTLDYKPISSIRADCAGMDEIIVHAIARASARCSMSKLVEMLERWLGEEHTVLAQGGK